MAKAFESHPQEFDLVAVLLQAGAMECHLLEAAEIRRLCQHGQLGDESDEPSSEMDGVGWIIGSPTIRQQCCWSHMVGGSSRQGIGSVACTGRRRHFNRYQVFSSTYGSWGQRGPTGGCLGPAAIRCIVPDSG